MIREIRGQKKSPSGTLRKGSKAIGCGWLLLGLLVLLQDAGFDYDSADQVMQPKNEVELSLEDARKVSKLIDNLDDLDDVQNIYSNWTASDEVMAQLDEE